MKEVDLPGGKQKSYFIDSQAFGGNSGGPAFVLLERNESGGMIIGWHFALLGVVTQFVPSPLRTQKFNLEDTTQKQGLILIENTGITKVVPVDYLVDILFSDEQLKFRTEIVKAKKAKMEKKK